MNFIKRIFLKKDYEKIELEWNKKIEKAYKSVKNDKLEYPIIMFSDVFWDFSVYINYTDLIRESIAGHWGLNEYLHSGSHKSDIVIDSKGNQFELSHEHYDEITKIEFSYPSIFIKKETFENIQERIIHSCEEYIECYSKESKEKNIESKIHRIKKMNSIRELILLVKEELYFYE